MRSSSIFFLVIFEEIDKILISKDLVMQIQAKLNDKNRRFGVFMTLLSRRNKNYKVCGKVKQEISRQCLKLININPFARIESLCTFRVGFRSLMKSISFTKQSNLFLPFLRMLKRLSRSFGTLSCCSW